jgi:hypothetical protein
MPIAAAIASASPPVRFRARSGPRPRPDVNAQETRRIEAEAERAARARDAAARLDRLLEALELFQRPTIGHLPLHGFAQSAAKGVRAGSS